MNIYTAQAHRLALLFYYRVTIDTYLWICYNNYDYDSEISYQEEDNMGDGLLPYWCATAGISRYDDSVYVFNGDHMHLSEIVQ